MNKNIVSLIWASLSAGMLLAGQVSAATVSLDFNSLPSSQGWDYQATGNSTLEADIFSNTGTSLFSNSMGIGFQPSGSSNFYSFSNIVDESLPFTLSLRARIIEEERAPGDNNAYGFGFIVRTSIHAFSFGMGLTELGFAFNQLIPVGDNTVFRDYQLSANPVTGVFDLLVDGVSVLSGVTLDTGFDGTNSVLFGDSTGATNANAEITSFVFTQNASAVPIPSVIWLFLSGLFGLAGIVRRKY